MGHIAENRNSRGLANRNGCIWHLLLNMHRQIIINLNNALL